ncbi:MAG: AraC family transcriptional regulator [Fibrobacteria bacterium]|nr:AraC family transcriptional regulator [Fibrobacteria bacterium]
MDSEEFKTAFLKSLDNVSSHLAALLDNFPDIFFWMKNRNGQFIMCNRAFAEKCGVHRESEVIGKTDFDFFPHYLAKNYVADDVDVMENERRILNRVELVPNEDGSIDWHSTSKEPLMGKDGSIVGSTGTTRNLKKSGAIAKPYTEMSGVVDYISQNFHSPLEVSTLAKMACLSVSQFERKFKSIFKVSPMGFIIKVRIKAACKELMNTSVSISQIAGKMGFFDQSHFSKQFRRIMGTSPRAFRKQYFQGRN